MMMVDHQENNPVANVFLDLITAGNLSCCVSLKHSRRTMNRRGKEHTREHPNLPFSTDFLEKRRQERATDPNEVQGFCGSKRVFVPDRNVEIQAVFLLL